MFLDLKTPMMAEDVLGERRSECILCCSGNRIKKRVKRGQPPEEFLAQMPKVNF